MGLMSSSKVPSLNSGYSVRCGDSAGFAAAEERPVAVDDTERHGCNLIMDDELSLSDQTASEAEATMSKQPAPNRPPRLYSGATLAPPNFARSIADRQDVHVQLLGPGMMELVKAQS